MRQGTGEPEWLFPKADGTLMNRDYAAGVFRRLLKRSGLPHYRVYDLRHTFASLLLTYVSAQLGHSSPATTMRFCARWIPSKGKRWVDSTGSETGRRAQRSAAAGAKLEPESEPAPGAREGADASARRSWLPGLGSNQRLPD